LEYTLPRYRERRDALLDALQSSMPDGVLWTRPSGGFCCWLTLPSEVLDPDFRQIALQNGVSYAPGEAFLLEPDGCAHMRLCFSMVSAERIPGAVAVLANLIRQSTLAGHANRRAFTIDRPLV
jgi:DNA-binding transcriptional MocR family regulator